MSDTIRGRDIRPGDVLGMAVGPTLVLAVKETHGGFECRVNRRGDSPFLWFWPSQPVTLLRRDPEKAYRLAQKGAQRLAALRCRVEGDRAPAPDLSHSESIPGGTLS